VLVRTLRVASVCVLLCLGAGFPLAYWLARTRIRWKSLLIMLVVLPLFVGNAVHAAGWMVMFGSKGVIDTVLGALGLISAPIQLMYTESFGATAIGLIALSVVRRFEGKDDGIVRRRVAVTTAAGAASVSAILAALRAQGCAVSNTEYESALDEGRVTVTLDVQVPAGLAPDALLQALEGQPGVAHVRIAPH
jgi:hypothetical protein